MDPQRVTHVLYHGDCFDGFGAAWAAWKALGDRAKYIPVKHGQPPPVLPAGARVVLADFTYPRPQLLEMKSRIEDLAVLDHHKSAVEDLQDLDFARFDMSRAGSGLSWEFFHPGWPEPELLQYVEDGDLWRFELPDSRTIHAALESHPMAFKVWDSLSVADLRREGPALVRYKAKLVSAAANRVGFGEIAGFRVPVANVAAEIRSEVAEEILRRHPEALFAGVWFVNAEGRQAWSLRSRGDFDVSAPAGLFGGGGHAAAAGFSRAPGEWILFP